MIRKIIKVRYVGDTLVLTIPTEMIRESGIKKGDKVMITYEKENGFTVTKEECGTRNEAG